MGGKVRFIHAADIHLGSLLHSTGRAPQEISNLIKRVTYEAFVRICNAAIKYSVDFVLLAGDLYDHKSRSVAANQFFVHQCQRLEKENIPVYIIAGNHDPLQEQGELFDLPKNVFIFDSEQVEVQEVVNKEGELIARILGQSYRGRSESRKMYSSFTVPDTGVCNIGILHTQLDPTNNNYVPCSLNDLICKNDIHYWALGHIHQPRILHRTHPVIAYSGIPQGRDFGEEGVGGCFLVEMTPQNEPEIWFIPTSSVVWKRVEIAIDEDEKNVPENFTCLENLILNKAEDILNKVPPIPEGFKLAQDNNWPDFFQGYIIQWILTGRGEIHDLLVEQEEEAIRLLVENLQDRLKDRKPFLWTESVVVRTGKPLPHLKSLKEQNPIFAEIEEIVHLSLTDAQFKKDLVSELGQIWEDRVDHENINEQKFQLDEETLQAIVKQAEEIVIEKLIEGREL
ncbi:hypothetical protein BBF96_13655 [Anoxybacter fermentans]|uniref:Calcineurin-like phosphoesterase domain-containing protein n=1 Tax=Anoxybacter fermentans TaxID=1323375 RepID=A0A3S9T1B6_9FIRM|nr:DNA repair exonuclease [Anoxybacter fermentans]AZR74341.1 hypothetical protein BBF96_13655 [Anoxybacter fermentans]